MKNLIKYSGLLVFGFAISCQTTSYVANFDSGKKKIEIQSQADTGSAIYTLQKKGVLNSVRADLKKRLKKKPKDVKAMINLSQVYLAQGNIKKAEMYCRRALKFDLNNKSAKLILAQVYFRNGYSDMAEIILDSLGKSVEKDSIALNLKALVALKNDRPAYAMHFFKESLKYNPSDIATRMNLGVLYVYYRQVDAASVQFERVLKIMPNHVDAKLHLAVVKSSRGQLDLAEGLYKDVLDVDPKNALATYNLAVLEEKRKNLDDSLGYIRSYLSSNYAKKEDNKEVFAMIERLRAKKDMIGESVSDSEIQELAGQLDKPARPEDSFVEDEEVVTKKPSSNEKVRESKPVKKKTKKKIEYDDDDIESLERALIE